MSAAVPRQAQLLRQAQDEEEEDEDEEEETGEEDRFVFEDESARQLFGDRYDEFKARFERAVNAVDLDALDDLAADFGDANLPWCREKSREEKNNGPPDCALQDSEHKARRETKRS